MSLSSTNKAKDILIARNKKAFFDYEILKKFNAGIELYGTEVRSLRDKNCQLTDTFVTIRKGEAWLHNLHISPFKFGNINNTDPDRRRRLLLHKKEIRELRQKTEEKGMSIVPTKIYFKRGHLVKVDIAIAKGKKLHDKRQALAKKTQMREAREYIKNINRN